MAPEVKAYGAAQTPKADVWSLLVTMLVTLNIDGLRGVGKGTPLMWYQNPVPRIQKAAAHYDLARYGSYADMAEMDSEKRPSAAELLARNFSAVAPAPFAPAPFGPATTMAISPHQAQAEGKSEAVGSLSNMFSTLSTHRSSGAEPRR